MTIVFSRMMNSRWLTDLDIHFFNNPNAYFSLYQEYIITSLDSLGIPNTGF